MNYRYRNNSGRMYKRDVDPSEKDEQFDEDGNRLLRICDFQEGTYG